MSFHNETFDLAFYARMAWGYVHHDHWEPILNAQSWGLHLSFVLVPLGYLGMVFGTVPVLLISQSLALAFAAWPLARIAKAQLDQREVQGPFWLPLVLPLCFLLHPNTWVVSGNEFHPSSIAVFFLVWMLDAAMSKRTAGMMFWGTLTLLCREDLAWVVALLSLAGAVHRFRNKSEDRKWLPWWQLPLTLVWVGYFAFFLFWVHPKYAPPNGSFALHFGHLGENAKDAVSSMMRSPEGVLAHLVSEPKRTYLLLLAVPTFLLFLPGALWLLPALPLLGINLLSRFPTSSELTEHYSSLLLPLLFAAASVGFAHLLRALSGRSFAVLLSSSLVLVHVALTLVLGFFPGSDAPYAFLVDTDPLRNPLDGEGEAPDELASARTTLDLIRRRASVQAPYRLLAHIAERKTLAASPPPERPVDLVVLEATHRTRFAHREGLLRASEEPLLRDWLSKDDRMLIGHTGPFYVFARGLPRQGFAFRDESNHEALVEENQSIQDNSLRLTECLSLEKATLRSNQLELQVFAHSPCDADIALRVGTEKRPHRVELLGQGIVPPSHLRAGDRIVSEIALSQVESTAIRSLGLRVGAIRESGARPHYEDPMTVYLPPSMLQGRARP